MAAPSASATGVDLGQEQCVGTATWTISGSFLGGFGTARVDRTITRCEYQQEAVSVDGSMHPHQRIDTFEANAGGGWSDTFDIIAIVGGGVALIAPAIAHGPWTGLGELSGITGGPFQATIHWALVSGTSVREHPEVHAGVSNCVGNISSPCTFATTWTAPRAISPVAVTP